MIICNKFWFFISHVKKIHDHQHLAAYLTDILWRSKKDNCSRYGRTKDRVIHLTFRRGYLCLEGQTSDFVSMNLSDRLTDRSKLP